jgi:hypothetical protein
MDNFYNSVQLSRKLLQKKPYVTGTLRSNLKHNPREVIAQKLKRESQYADIQRITFVL